MSYHRVVGIDLGTAYWRVAAFSDRTEEAVVLRNRDTDREITPSFVGIDRATGRVLVGAIARRNLPFDPANTVTNVKRLLGESVSQGWPGAIGAARGMDLRTAGEFAVRHDRPDGPVHVPLRGERFLPQEIVAFLLMKSKEIAEAEIGAEVQDAVIAVPGCFLAHHRAAIEEAARLAGLYPLDLVAETTAAAVASCVDDFVSERRVYLVYDLGAGMLDVSVVAVEGCRIDVVASAGDRRLGGVDFDDAVADWAIARLLEEEGLDVAHDPRARALVKCRAEEAKKELSVFGRAKLVFLELRPDRPPILEITRDAFVGLIAARARKMLDCVDRTLRHAEEKGIGPDSIDGVLLTGGASRISYVRTMLVEYFQRGDDFVRDLDPSATVARGAAILARQFEPTPPPFDVNRLVRNGALQRNDRDEVEISAIAERTLGIGVIDGRGEAVVRPVIARGTRIPVAARLGGFRCGEHATTGIVPVYQGEGTLVADCERVGVVLIGPMEPSGRPQEVELTFSLDSGGRLTATVHYPNGRDRADAFRPAAASEPADLPGVRSNLLRLYRG